MKNIACSFIGHRKIDITEDLKLRLKEVIENLITKKNVNVFLFGSQSEFNSLCHLLVTELKQKYPDIKRIAYTCRSETCTLERERQKWETIYSHQKGREIHLLGVEEEFEHKTKYTSRRASYVERNQAMINDSDYCIFYYNKNYQPEPRKNSKSMSSCRQKSGTAISFAYAKQKKKNSINIASL